MLNIRIKKEDLGYFSLINLVGKYISDPDNIESLPTFG